VALSRKQLGFRPKSSSWSLGFQDCYTSPRTTIYRNSIRFLPMAANWVGFALGLAALR
jgi:hypothetical protein